MKHAISFASACLLLLASAGVLFGGVAPQEDAVVQFRAYVTAVRAGNADNVVKLIEPVPKSCKALLGARVAQAVAVEAMKKEMVTQMGPARTGDESWDVGGLPWDDALERLRAVAQDADTVALSMNKPDGTAGWMVRRNGKWIVPAGLVMDLEPGPFVEPEADEREEMMQHANAVKKAANVVLARLRNKEFKTPAEVRAALGAEITKATSR